MSETELEVEIVPLHEEKKVSDLGIELRNHEDKVLIIFGEPVRWIGVDRDTALSIAEALIHHARQVPNADN